MKKNNPQNSALTNGDKKNFFKETSTIAACSTGFPGAIAVVRLSGCQTKQLLESYFFAKKELLPRVVVTGKIDVGGIFDTATAVFFKAPDSYTGEDMAEISLHANPVMVEKLLAALIKSGAQPAQRGEFTYRAFLNGKMDLSAAEAVADIISAESESEIKYAYRQMKGELREKIDGLQEKLTEALAGFNAAIDFPEENIENDVVKQSKPNLVSLKTEIKKLLDSYASGRFIKSGVRATIVGDVNVGKSSLLNALLKKQRAIVTDIPGTTRDTLEDRFEYKGQKFIITDTAGIRKSKNKIEAEGIERAKKIAEDCDIVIAVTEVSKPFDGQTQELVEKLYKSGKKIIVVENKTDLSPQKAETYPQKTADTIYSDLISVSAKTGQNIEKLKEKLFKTVTEEENIDYSGLRQDKGGKGQNKDAVTVTELRHYQALNMAEQFLTQAEESIEKELTLDLVASDFMSAYNELGRITGNTASDEIIDTIFARFCVGK